MQPGDQFLHVRRGHVGQRQPGQVGVAKLQHPRPERELPAVTAHVAEPDQGQQEPAGGGPGQPGGLGYLAEAEVLPVRPEGADDGQPAVQ